MRLCKAGVVLFVVLGTVLVGCKPSPQFVKPDVAKWSSYICRDVPFKQTEWKDAKRFKNTWHQQIWLKGWISERKAGKIDVYWEYLQNAKGRLQLAKVCVRLADWNPWLYFHFRSEAKYLKIKGQDFIRLVITPTVRGPIQRIKTTKDGKVFIKRVSGAFAQISHRFMIRPGKSRAFKRKPTEFAKAKVVLPSGTYTWRSRSWASKLREQVPHPKGWGAKVRSASSPSTKPLAKPSSRPAARRP